MIEKINMLGGVTTLAYFNSMIVIFVLRLLGKAELGAKLDLVQTLIAIPTAGYLLYTACQFERPKLSLFRSVYFWHY